MSGLSDHHSQIIKKDWPGGQGSLDLLASEWVSIHLEEDLGFRLGYAGWARPRPDRWINTDLRPQMNVIVKTLAFFCIHTF